MIGFNAISAAWLFSLLAPLIILYFLKLKRQRLVVPSLYLWQQVLNDQRVNSPFQRFKRHILLLLQLLILIALILAAMRPFFHGSSEQAFRTPILLDNSASMSAKDSDGKSRLEIAKEKIREMINQKTSEQQMAIITFSDTSKKCCGFTDNRRILLNKLDEIVVEDKASDIEDALRMIQAMARNYDFDEALLFSDGNFPAEANFNLSFKLNFQKMPGSGENIGITSLNAKRASDKTWQIFAQIDSTPNAGGAKIKLFKNGELLGEENFVPSEQGNERISFNVPGDEPSELKMVLVPSESDSLGSDNTAYLSLPILRPMALYIPERLKSVRAAIAGIQGIVIYPIKDVTPPAEFDLVISDKLEDLGLETSTLMLVGKVPDDLSKIIDLKPDSGEIIDWNRASPLLQHVELSDVITMERPCLIDPEANVESHGYEILAHGSKGPMMLARNLQEKRVYYLLFDPGKSTLPYRLAYPIMFSNLILAAQLRAGLADMTANRTGCLPDLRLDPETNYKISRVGGKSISEKSDSKGWLKGIPAPLTGEYMVSGSDNKSTIGVSLLDESETKLGSVEKIQFNELSVKAEAKALKTPKSLWRQLALLAFIILLVEWWFFQKRPGRILS